MPIKDYTRNPQTLCFICGQSIKPWAVVQCDNCGRKCCRTHRPYFTQYWTCPDCIKNQQKFTTNMPSIPQNTQANTQQVFAQMRNAEKLIDNNRISEANEEIVKLFINLFGSES